MPNSPMRGPKEQNLTASYRLAYMIVCNSMEGQSTMLIERDARCKVFMVKTPIIEDLCIWQYLILQKEHMQFFWENLDLLQPICMLKFYDGGLIIPTKMEAQQKIDIYWGSLVVGLACRSIQQFVRYNLLSFPSLQTTLQFQSTLCGRKGQNCSISASNTCH